MSLTRFTCVPVSYGADLNGNISKIKRICMLSSMRELFRRCRGTLEIQQLSFHILQGICILSFLPSNL